MKIIEGEYSKFDDGFWCSHKMYEYIQDKFEIDEKYPWYGKKVYADQACPNDKAYLIENGIVDKVFEIDWGLQ